MGCHRCSYKKWCDNGIKKWVCWLLLWLLVKSCWEVLKDGKCWNRRGYRLEHWKTSFNFTGYSAGLPFYWAEHILSPTFCFFFPIFPLDSFYILYWQTKSFPYCDKNIPFCINFTTHIWRKMLFSIIIFCFCISFH
jgi:hypothetical protein